MALAKFQEDDCIVEMEVEGINKEFPYCKDEQEEGELAEESSNNNATVGIKDSQGHFKGDVNKPATSVPGSSENGPTGGNPNLEQSFTLLQSFMIQKGLMTEELSEFMETGGKTPGSKNKSGVQPKGNKIASDSETTIYQ